MSRSRRPLRSAGFVGLGLSLYLLFLLATAPAVWLATAAERLSGGALQLRGATGTLWVGKGELHAGAVVPNPQHLGTLRWQVNPLWLVVGRAQLAAQLDGPSVRAEAVLRLARREYAVRDLNATFPAPLAGLVYAPVSFFQPTGTVNIRASSLELSAAGLTGDAEAIWRGAGGRFTGPTPLGDYRLGLKGNGATAMLQLSGGGQLQAEGQGQWRVGGDGELQFAGSVTAAGDAAALEPLLRGMGRDLGGGRRELRFNARAPLVRQLGL